MSTDIISQNAIRPIWKEIKAKRYLYLILAPGMVWLFVFAYGPMYGAQIAFKDYMFNRGIWGSPWVGFEKFQSIFIDPQFWQAFRNTIIISVGRIFFTFPFPILLALLFNELPTSRYKGVLQTIYTFPNFLSWISVAGIMLNLFGSSGVINNIISSFGGEPIKFLVTPGYFRPLLYISAIWKEAGWSSIIYMAAISAVDPNIYEAAAIDGAGRWQKMFRITLPIIKPTIMVLLILNIGGIMNAGFDQIFNLYNPVVYETGDIIDTFIYRKTFQMGFTDYSFTTAVGLFKSVANFILLLMANKLAHLMGQPGLYQKEGN